MFAEVKHKGSVMEMFFQGEAKGRSGGMAVACAAADLIFAGLPDFRKGGFRCHNCLKHVPATKIICFDKKDREEEYARPTFDKVKKAYDIATKVQNLDWAGSLKTAADTPQPFFKQVCQGYFCMAREMTKGSANNLNRCYSICCDCADTLADRMAFKPNTPSVKIAVRSWQQCAPA